MLRRVRRSMPNSPGVTSPGTPPQAERPEACTSATTAAISRSKPLSRIAGSPVTRVRWELLSKCSTPVRLSRDAGSPTTEASGNGLVYITTTGSANADALFDKCTVSDNTTTGSAVASGLYIYNNGGAIDVVVTNSTFSGNATAGRGGAIYARNNQSGDVNVTCANSTFAANRSGSYGGAIALYGAAAKKVNVSLVSCTLTGNDDTHATALGGGVGLETAGLSADDGEQHHLGQHGERRRQRRLCEVRDYGSRETSEFDCWG